ncbi:MAG: helix-turn-helix transcriptional regulator [Thermodesulfovibrionia bacterium]|nr:helix-turn-helix transcriptional regulator [Thermodesulfovibrionia bacterium]
MKKNRAILKNDLKKTILNLFSVKDMYGYEVIKKVEINGEKIDAPRIYTILKELNNEGLLVDHWERSQTGPRRRIYSLAEKGREALLEQLLEAISYVHHNYGVYLASLYPKIDLVGDILTPLLKGKNGKINIGYFTNKNYGMNNYVLSRLQQMMPEANIFLIKPRSVDITTKIENVEILSGRYEEFTLKDGFADVLVIVDLPEEEQIEPAIKEWHRVISPEGRLAIMTPSVLVKKRGDPISIGDYVEKHEHEVFGQSNHVDGEYLKKILGGFFDEVEEKIVVHMTVITAEHPVPLQ